MGIYTFGPPQNLVLPLRDMFSISTFVETGTFKGDTTAWAAEKFEQVITIEASQPIYAAAQKRFSGASSVKSLFGSSPAVLQTLIADLPRSIFWLDAHWCGGNTAGPKDECPLLAELSVIMPYFHRHILLIDDARLFVRPPPLPHQSSEWPSLDDILRCSSASAQTYTAIYKDVIAIVPAVYRHQVSALLQQLNLKEPSEE